MPILVFVFIAKATPVDMYHSKRLLAKRICKNGRIDYKVKKPHDILPALRLVEKQNYSPFWVFRCSFLDDILNQKLKHKSILSTKPVSNLLMKTYVMSFNKNNNLSVQYYMKPFCSA